ncbi:flagellar biosynthetic protein FliR [Dethiosulfatarculus sandiegensis]|uniref:Flagellar biosynthetic protein FliR n=1 Tax=Dethiosulfatarculus sandiegensis TaxID=1429043 RepID=A0A0D2J608_9BACT|nr:flagellar biosynthetic protein FliR [Dethiosulfatarculus sandiegensis]KIX13519.1 hypothetical protein X474_13620 [Dethiosulfatarculus sandiegensis]
MILEGFDFGQWMAFLLVLVRTSAVMATMPFFSSQNLPPMAKAGLSFALAIWLYPVVKLDPALFPNNVWQLALLAVGELMIGAILGFTVRLFLTAVQIMGQLVGFQMGFAVANVIDPMGGGQVSVLAQLCYLMVLLTMFAVGGHLWIIKALADSFTLIQPGGFALSENLYAQMLKYSGGMFSMAVRLGAPVIGALLFTQVTMGILAKTVPQMNILIVGFPLTISVGLFFLAVTIPLIVSHMAATFRGLGPVFIGLLKAM